MMEHMIALSWCQGWKRSANTPNDLIFIQSEAVENISFIKRTNVFIRRILYNILICQMSTTVTCILRCTTKRTGSEAKSEVVQRFDI